MRKLHGEGTLAELKEVKAGRRHYSAQEILNARHILKKSSRLPGKYVPRRNSEDKVQIFQFMNFKGESSESTATIHLAHYFAFRGY